MEEREFTPNPGDTLLFENERIRVWSMTLSPQEVRDFHQHHHDHVILWPWRGRAQGQQYEQQEYGSGKWGIVQNAEPGFVMFKTVGSQKPLTPHRIRNVGDEPVEHFIIELLGPSPSLVELPWDANDRGEFTVS